MEEKLENSAEKEKAVEYRSLFAYDLDPALKNKARDELHEDDESIKHVMAQFKDLIAKSDDYSNILLKDDDYLPFLRGGKYDVKRVHAKFLNYVHLFRKYDRLFKDFDFSSCLKAIQTNIVCFLPRRDADGCTVILCLFRFWDVSEFDMADIIKAVVAGFVDNIRCPSTQINGVKIIVDYGGLSLRTLTSFPFWAMKFASDGMQGALPCRLKGYHVVNNGSLFTFIWAMLGPLLSKKLKERVHFHGSDYKSLHKYVSSSILPTELGGESGPLDNTEWLSKLSESKEHITEFIQRARKEQQIS